MKLKNEAIANYLEKRADLREDLGNPAHNIIQEEGEDKAVSERVIGTEEKTAGRIPKLKNWKKPSGYAKMTKEQQSKAYRKAAKKARSDNFVKGVGDTIDKGVKKVKKGAAIAGATAAVAGAGYVAGKYSKKKEEKEAAYNDEGGQISAPVAGGIAGTVAGGLMPSNATQVKKLRDLKIDQRILEGQSKARTSGVNPSQVDLANAIEMERLRNTNMGKLKSLKRGLKLRRGGKALLGGTIGTAVAAGANKLFGGQSAEEAATTPAPNVTNDLSLNVGLRRSEAAQALLEAVARNRGMSSGIELTASEKEAGPMTIAINAAKKAKVQGISVGQFYNKQRIALQESLKAAQKAKNIKAVRSAKAKLKRLKINADYAKMANNPAAYKGSGITVPTQGNLPPAIPKQPPRLPNRTIDSPDGLLTPDAPGSSAWSGLTPRQQLGTVGTAGVLGGIGLNGYYNKEATLGSMLIDQEPGQLPPLPAPSPTQLPPPIPRQPPPIPITNKEAPVPGSLKEAGPTQWAAAIGESNLERDLERVRSLKEHGLVKGYARNVREEGAQLRDTLKGEAPVALLTEKQRAKYKEYLQKRRDVNDKRDLENVKESA